jgi:5-methylcytosine-specific restriction endonuclease McrA
LSSFQKHRIYSISNKRFYIYGFMVYPTMQDFSIWNQMKKSQKNNTINFGFVSSSSKDKFERIPLKRSEKDEILMNQKGKCAYPRCQVHFHRDGVLPHFDHIKEVSKGGTNKLSNIQALCPNHHGIKHHKANVQRSQKNVKRKKNNDPFAGTLLGSAKSAKPPKWGFGV